MSLHVRIRIFLLKVCWYYRTLVQHEKAARNVAAFSCCTIFLLLIFSILITVNEVSSNHLQISRSLINFKARILIFKEFQEPLKRHFIFKDFERVQGPKRDL